MTRLTNTEVKLKKEKTSQLYCMFNSLKMLSDWPEINKTIINQFISAIIQPQCTTKKTAPPKYPPSENTQRGIKQFIDHNI